MYRYIVKHDNSFMCIIVHFVLYFMVDFMPYPVNDHILYWDLLHCNTYTTVILY